MQNESQPQVQPIVEEPAVSLQEALAHQQEEVVQVRAHWKQLHEDVEQTLNELDEAERKLKCLKHAAASAPRAAAPTTAAPHKPGQKLSAEVRALANPPTWDELAKTFQISRSSIHRISKELHEEEERERDAALGVVVGRKAKLDGEHLTILLEWIDNDPGLTLKELATWIKSEFSINLTPSTVSRYLEKLDVSWKEATHIPEQWNTEAVRAARQAFVRDQVRNYIGRPLVFLDECGFNLHVRKPKGRAPRGEPARLTLLPRQRNITLIAALSNNGIIYSRLYKSTDRRPGVTADDFRLFLLDLRRSGQLPPEAVLLLDNAPIHHTAAVASVFDDLRSFGFEVLFLPPYSPFLNPIEYAFAKVKGIVRRASFTTRAELSAAIERATHEVTPDDAKGWFRHMVRYYHQCALSLPFRGKPLRPELFETTTHLPDSLQHQWRALTQLEASPSALPPPPNTPLLPPPQ